MPIPVWNEKAGRVCVVAMAAAHVELAWHVLASNPIFPVNVTVPILFPQSPQSVVVISSEEIVLHSDAEMVALYGMVAPTDGQ